MPNLRDVPFPAALGRRTCRPLLAAALLCLLAPAAPAAGLKAGAARADITPPTGAPMWGYASRHDAPSVGVRDRLYATAVVLDGGEGRVAVVSLDLGRAPARASFAAIRRAVRDECGVGHLFLVASHTHHGPVLEVDDWPAKGPSYTKELERKLITLIGDAAKSLRPARYGVAAARTGLNRNRHSRLPDPPVDDELVVMRLEDGDGGTIATLVNFAAHPTMLPRGLHQFSPDFPGFLAAEVQKATSAPCLFLQGAAGDLSPNPGAARGPEEFGRALAREVLALGEKIRCDSGADVTLGAADREFRFRSRFDLSNPFIHAAFAAAFFPGIVNFYEREYREGVRPRLTTAVLDGRVGFVGVSGEFFCDHAVQLKRRARLDHVLFLGYCNDYQQYFPTIQAAAEGGYGADPLVSPVEVGAGEAMMDRALIDLYELRGRLADAK